MARTAGATGKRAATRAAPERSESAARRHAVAVCQAPARRARRAYQARRALLPPAARWKPAAAADRWAQPRRTRGRGAPSRARLAQARKQAPSVAWWPAAVRRAAAEQAPERGHPTDALAPAPDRRAANRRAAAATDAAGRPADARRSRQPAAGTEREAPRLTAARARLAGDDPQERSARPRAFPEADGPAAPGLPRPRNHRRHPRQNSPRDPRTRPHSAAALRPWRAAPPARRNAGKQPAGRPANCRPETVPRNGDRRIALQQPSVHLTNASRGIFVMVDHGPRRSQSPCRTRLAGRPRSTSPRPAGYPCRIAQSGHRPCRTRTAIRRTSNLPCLPSGPGRSAARPATYRSAARRLSVISRRQVLERRPPWGPWPVVVVRPRMSRHGQHPPGGACPRRGG